MGKSITIGRNPSCTIHISEDYDIVSNDHAEIIQQEGELMFVDHSSNGTIINGQKIKGKNVNIYPGDKIVLAGVYELSWDKINTYIVPIGRPTVARNIRGNGVIDAGRRMEVQAYKGQFQQTYTAQRESRVTEFMNRNETFGRNSVHDYPGTRINDEEECKIAKNSSQIDHEINQWNWGAFFFGWLWGVFNRVYISLLQLIASILAFGLILIGVGVIAPFFSLACLGIAIWLGVKGSRIAWDNGAYHNIEHFCSVRHGWNVAAAITFGVSVFMLIISLLLFIDVISRVL